MTKGLGLESLKTISHGLEPIKSKFQLMSRHFASATFGLKLEFTKECKADFDLREVPHQKSINSFEIVKMST